MSDYATPTNNVPTILNPVVYFRISAFALAAVAVLGFVMNIIDGAVSTSLGFGNTFLNFTYAHDAVHLILAAAAFLFGFGNLSGSTVKTFAIIFGFVYAGLGVIGFFMFTGAGGDQFLALTPALNVVHLLLGGYALVSGFSAKFD